MKNKAFVSLLLNCEPTHCYFDIASSIPQEEIVVVSFDSLPKGLPMLKLHPYFGYLFNGGGGGFSFETKVDESHFHFKWYSLVIHHLFAKSKVQWNVPDTKWKLKQILLSLQALLQKLQSSDEIIGGHRVEIRYYQKGFWSSLYDFQKRRPFDTNSLRGLLDILIDKVLLPSFPSNLLNLEFISKTSYLKYLDALLKIAFHVPNPDTLFAGGIFYGDTSKKLDEFEHKMVEMLFNSFGYSSEKQRHFNCASDIEDWIGRHNYGNIANWRKVIMAAEKISSHSVSLMENLASVSVHHSLVVDSVVLSDIISKLKLFHPKKDSKKFKTHRKGTLGITPVFESKRDLALYVYQMTATFHQDNPSEWRKYFSSK